MERYDYSKLLGLMREKRITQTCLAKKVGISETSMNFSLNNKRDFKQEEILSAFQGSLFIVIRYVELCLP